MTSTSRVDPSTSLSLDSHGRLSHPHESTGNAPYAKWLRVDNLRAFRQTFNKFLDMFEEVINLRDHDGAVEIFNNLVKLRANEWKAMEAAMDLESESESRVLRNRESQVVITVLQSVVSGIDSFITAAQCKLDIHISEIEIACRREIAKLHEENHQLRRDVSDVRWWHNEDKTALRRTQRDLVLLKSALKDKEDQIRNLKKDSNVQHWKEEKRKIVAKYQAKIDELENSLSKLRLTTPQQLKIPNRDENMLLGEIGEMDSETIAEKLRLMEKDIRHHSRCVREVQSHCASVLHGFKTDFEHFIDRLLDENPAVNDRHRSAILHLEDRLRSVLSYTTSNPLMQPEEFPTHYNKRISCQPVILERESQPITRLSTPSPRQSFLDPEVGFSHETDHTCASTLFDHNEFPRANNPDFVFTDSKEINFDAVMRYFPQMTREYIEEQWEQFTKFDKNNDFSLDLNEMMGAMYSTTGHEFNPREIKEAMLEADLDGSNTIDFFEFLNVANMLMRKSGNSNFQSSLFRKQRKNISSTCALQ